MPQPLHRLRLPRWHLAAAIALLLLFAAQLIHVATAYSLNWDEAHHLYDGWRIWTLRDYRLNAEVPPLVKLAAALPILPLHPQIPPSEHKSQASDAFRDGRLFVFNNGGDRLILPARMACMLITLLLACLLYASAQSLFGPIAALAALLLFTFDPTVLAHGTLISTDIASALFIFATVLAFYRYTEAPTLPNLLLTGLAMGLGMVSKYTCVLLAPMLILLLAAEARRQRSWHALRRLLAAASAIFLFAWIVIWSFYALRDSPAPAGLKLSPDLPDYIASLHTKGGAAFLGIVARLHLLPQAYIWGLADTKHKEWEYVAYFFNRIYRHGPWLYFPAAFLIKSTLPLLLLLLLASFLLRGHSAISRKLLLFLLIPTCFYFLIVTLSHFDIGNRHLLPIYPFLYLLAGAVVAAMWQRGRPWTALAILLLGWQVVTSARVAPAYMAYGNEAWGGPLQVRRYLSDANVDWGQQLKAVHTYLESNNIHDCWFAYFPDGAVEPQDYGIHCNRLPTPTSLFWLQLPMDVPPTVDGTVLISESVLEGVESGDGKLNPYNSFRWRKPDSIIQDGVYVYRGRFDIPLASAWVDIRRSGELVRSGDLPAALTVAQQAATLAPDSALVQSNLASLLAQQGNWQSAHVHYQLAQHWLESTRPDLQADELGPPIRNGLAEANAHLRR